jgi:putative transposase
LLREDRSAPTAANQVWAMDFVHDQLFDGRKIRALTIVDTFTRLSPAIDVRQSFRGSDVVDTLERVIPEVGCPKTIRLDNGPEFVFRWLARPAEVQCYAAHEGPKVELSTQKPPKMGAAAREWRQAT